jgi:hypothetical protein
VPNQVTPDMLLRLTKVAWLIAAATVYAATLAAFDGKPNSDAEDLLGWGMLVLSFPASILYAAAFSLMAEWLLSQFGTVVSTSYTSMTVSWMAMLALGYVQWFVLMPKLIRKWKAGRTSGRGPRLRDDSRL